MQIISHRGFWLRESEKNTKQAFLKSFESGFGTETDLRDFKQEVVISHDMSSEDCVLFSDFLEFHSRFSTLTLALNVKADGLQSEVFKQLLKYDVKNYFLFDMSIPDTLQYLKKGMKVFARQSEYETFPLLYDKATGVWMDEFNQHWIDKRSISKHIENGKKVCIVSPELHGRPYELEWQHYLEIDRELNCNDLMICTDKPEEAKKYFNG